ncbi:MAG: HAMP domain-containing histidine kinase, partial [Rhodovulum sp.]|nr:HAMP domain-containing histidine kinase [Rhodovulum sp.]
VFGTVLAGIRATLMYGFDNAKLAIVHKAQADRIARQNADLALIVSSLSHDLKSPVRNVRTLVTMRHALKAQRGMSDAQVDQEQIKSLKRIEDLSTSFIRYIRSRDEELETKPVRVAAVLRQVSAGYAGRVEISIEGDGDAVILGDRGALIRVFENLLENSIQHGRAEHPEAVFVVDQIEGRVRIRYEDNGVGIPPAVRERVFKPFQTQEPKHRSGASGLGLAIVERLTERMNGTIKIDDPVRLSGASFEMLFPSGDVQ